MSNKKIRVLYAEDSALDADLTLSFFHDSAPEFVLEIVPTGSACLEKLGNNAKYDLLLLDQHLPDREGLKILTTLRKQGQHPPVVMVTGSGNEELVIKALRLGATEYVVKNSGYLEQLPELLRRVVSRRRMMQHTGLEVQRDCCSILYVEHENMDVDLALRHFAEEAPHFQVLMVDSGQAALAELKKGLKQYHAIVSDLRLPDVSGLELLRKVRQGGLNLPFIIVTGRGDEEKAVAALNLGAYDYIIKRENYLTELTYSIENAIQRFQAEERTVQLHQELEQSHAALAEANKDLDAFTHSVAHELKGPLRAIVSFAQIAKEDLGEKVPASELDSLDRIATRAEKMTELVESLLSFSKLTRKDLMKETIDTGLMVQDVWDSLEEERKDRQVELKLGDLPHVQADSLLLKQVFTNLIGNALKFTRTQSVAQIVLGTIPDPKKGQLMFFVRDNGVGFAQGSAARLFEPFERLHHHSEYEGTGIGLVLVKRIVERHGGMIWAESRAGEGATFYWTIS